MADGATLASVDAELRGLIARLDELVPEAEQAVGFLREVNLTARVSTLKDAVVGDLSRVMWTLLGMVAFVLVIACANVVGRRTRHYCSPQVKRSGGERCCRRCGQVKSARRVSSTKSV